MMVMDPKDALKYATKVAFKIWPKALQDMSIGTLTWRAMTTYDGRISEKRWIAHVVKIAIFDRWRRNATRREEQNYEGWTNDVWIHQPTEEELRIPQEDFQILWENKIEKWCIDVVARRHGTSVAEMRRRLHRAMNKLREAYKEELGDAGFERPCIYSVVTSALREC